MRIIHSNKIQDATLIASSSKLGYGASLLKDKTPFTRLKFTGKTSEYVVMDLGSAQKISGFAAFNHNFTSSAIIKLEANSADNWSAPAFSVDVTASSYFLFAYFMEQTYRYWRLSVQDGTNAKTLEIGELYLGVAEELGYVSTDGVLNRTAVADKSVTRSGSVLGRYSYSVRSFSFNLAFLNPDKRHALSLIYQEHGVTEPIVIAIWEDAIELEAPVYCVFDFETLSFKRRGTRAFIADTSISFMEVL